MPASPVRHGACLGCAMDKFIEIFELQAGFAEMLIRGTTMYWVLYALLRISGRRDLGSLGMADMLVTLVLEDQAGGFEGGCQPLDHFRGNGSGGDLWHRSYIEEFGAGDASDGTADEVARSGRGRKGPLLRARLR